MSIKIELFWRLRTKIEIWPKVYELGVFKGWVGRVNEFFEPNPYISDEKITTQSKFRNSWTQTSLGWVRSDWVELGCRVMFFFVIFSSLISLVVTGYVFFYLFFLLLFRLSLLITIWISKFQNTLTNKKQNWEICISIS